MEKLKTIQKIFRVLGIFTKIAYWACIVGACCCAAGLLFLALSQMTGLISPEAAKALADVEVGMYPQAYGSVLIGLVNTFFSFLVVRRWRNYFKAEEEDGTPFNEETGKYLFDVAKYSLIMGIVAFVISVILDGLFLGGGKTGIDVKFTVDISSVIFTMFLSLVFRYGAEVAEGK